MKRAPLVLASLAGAATLASAQGVTPGAGMIRHPDASSTHIVFAYANDLWVVPREGGEARPLASPPGAETLPRFSPDGQSIAFVGNYEGGRDIYTIPFSGGPAFRVTHHPASEQISDWDESGMIIFNSNGMAGLARQQQVYIVSPDGGLPEKLPIPYGSAATVSPDGEWVAYTPYNRDGRTWKRYKGGLASDIWLLNMRTFESKRLTDWEGTDTQPMWIGAELWYLSDQGPESRLNLWKADPTTGRRKQVTKFTEYDCKFPAAGPGSGGLGEVVFTNGGTLYRVDAARGILNNVEVTVKSDAKNLRPKTVMAGDFMMGGAASSTGKRAVVEARGDIWTIPAEEGSPRRITATDDAAERDPTWSPSGKWIAYFGDNTGEYELYITQSDGMGETRQLTDGSQTYYFSGVWSPDSKKYAYTDKAGRILVTDIESGETTEIDRDEWANRSSLSWSPDSRYITYALAKTALTGVIVIYDTETNEATQVTSGFFNDSNPVFSTDGEWFYYVSNRDFSSPTYEDVGSTFIYGDTAQLIAVPLTDDVAFPQAAKSDDETWEEEEEETDADGAEADDAADEADEEADDKSPIHGVWEGSATGLAAMGLPDDEIEFTLEIIDNGDGTFSGESSTMGETEPYDSVEFDEATGQLVMTRADGPVNSEQRATLNGDTLTGTWAISAPAMGLDASGAWSASRTDAEPSLEGDDDASSSREEGDPVEIDFENFEWRAFALPVQSGSFAQLNTNDKGQLIYMRMGSGTIPSIKLFDITDDSPSEKNVLTGAGGYVISGDHKKLGVQAGAGFGMVSAAPGQSVSPIDMSNLRMRIDPRDEWSQLLRDAWRRHRDFFYVDNMHGVDWDGIYEQYAAMLENASSREDVSYIIGEMIAELNIGHAYYWGGDGESQPFENTGMLGVDYTIVTIPADVAVQVAEDQGRNLPDRAYAIKEMYHGAPWDTDAKGVLTRWDLDINEGDAIIAVNGNPLDVTVDPWAPFVGLAGESVTLTVLDLTPEQADPSDVEAEEDAEKPELLRDIQIVIPGSESSLRYRAWIENNRKMVDTLSRGRVGYIYVPNTGVDGQNDLFRQFYGQTGKDALIIDDRWNGGGQIPNRFIELLDRERTNYWYRRDGKDWPWPYDSHQGPKAMLINGAAGSGGDMFPWLFRHHELGSLIGTRTWGGLVGISGVPPLIDGGYTAVPNFGFYETDGTWGVEGYGVAPDFEVIDDPAEMQGGKDPQIEFAVNHLLRKLQTEAYSPPERPTPPDRSGMGIPVEDR